MTEVSHDEASTGSDVGSSDLRGGFGRGALRIGELMKYLVVTLTLLLTGCGLLPANPEVEPEFRILYAYFKGDAVRHNRELDYGNLVIKFGTLPSNIMGTCGGPKTVTINPVIWAQMSSWDRFLLIYHELGHCLLGQGHRQNSIMSPTLSDTQFAYAKEAYVDELFNFKDAPYLSGSHVDYDERGVPMPHDCELSK